MAFAKKTREERFFWLYPSYAVTARTSLVRRAARRQFRGLEELPGR